MVRAPQRAEFSSASFLVTFALAAALLLSPLWIFLRFHGASLLSAHALLVAAVLLSGAALIASVSERFVSVRFLAMASLAGLFVELQSESSLLAWQLGLAVAAAALLFYALRSRWKLLGPVAATFLVASGVLPVGGSDDSQVQVIAQPDSSLPPIVHLVLDEQIGVEGIPREFDRDGTAVRELRDSYLSRGFLVFGRAYSRHYLSRDSFSAMLNRGEATRYAGTSRRVYIARNQLFADLAGRGYAISVLQTDYLDFCEVPSGFKLAGCQSFALETPAVLDAVELPLAERAQLLVGMMLRLSSRLPGFDVGRVSPLAANAALDVAIERVAELQRGEALFVHVMLPHFPYAYDSTCTLRPDPSSWAYGEGADVAPGHYSEAGRRRRYPLYLQQVSCAQRRVVELLDALDSNPAARGAWVVVQGDHGSRIVTRRPSTRTASELTASDLSDGYSTLFAVRKPGYAARYDRRLLPIEALLPAALEPGAIGHAADWLQPPYVVLADKGGRAKHPLPEFERSDALGAALD